MAEEKAVGEIIEGQVPQVMTSDVMATLSRLQTISLLHFHLHRNQSNREVKGRIGELNRALRMLI